MASLLNSLSLCWHLIVKCSLGGAWHVLAVFHFWDECWSVLVNVRIRVSKPTDNVRGRPKSHIVIQGLQFPMWDSAMSYMPSHVWPWIGRCTWMTIVWCGVCRPIPHYDLLRPCTWIFYGHQATIRGNTWLEWVDIMWKFEHPAQNHLAMGGEAQDLTYYNKTLRNPDVGFYTVQQYTRFLKR